MFEKVWRACAAKVSGKFCITSQPTTPPVTTTRPFAVMPLA